MKILRRVKIGMLTAIIVMAAWSNAGHAETQTWKLQSMWLAGSTAQQILLRFCENVTAASGGRLKLECLPIRSVVQNTEGLEAVGSGIIDGMHIAPVYFSGQDAAFGVLGDLNAAYENPYQMQEWFHYRGGLELARELYKKYNVYFVGPAWWGVEVMPFKKPIRSLADFKGTKVRVPEGPSGHIFRKLGASPVAMPGTEIYTSLERGVIDGTDYGTISMNHDLGFHDIAKYEIRTFHSMPVVDVSFNLDKWNALPEDLKKLLEMAVRDLGRDFIQTIHVEDVKAQKAAEAQGLTVIEFSAEERLKLRKVAKEVWEDFAKGSKIAQRIYQSQLEWLRDLGLL